MTKTSNVNLTAGQPCSSSSTSQDGAGPSNSSIFPDNNNNSSGPFKRPPMVSPRGGGIKKRLGAYGSPRQQHQQQQGRGPNHFGRGRAAFQQNQNRFRYANAVINGNRNGVAQHNNGQHPMDQIVYVPPSRIRYTQDTVKSTFNDGRSLTETFRQLAAREIKKRDIPMIEVVEKDNQYWTLNNRRLAVFSELERKKLCKVIRVRVRPQSDAVTEWLQRNTTANSGKSVEVRVTADEAEKCPIEEIDLNQRLLNRKEQENNRKPENWSRAQYERQQVEKAQREREMRNPRINVPDGWGERRVALPTVGDAASSSAAATPNGEEVMFDPNELDFELDDLLLENGSMTADSGRGSSSNVSEACSQNGARTYTADEVFDADDIDFDNEDQYLDGVPPLETVEDVANAESTRTPRGPSPTPSEALTTNFGRNFRLNSPLRRQFIVEESAGGRKVFADSSSSSSAPASGDPMNLLPVTRVLNLGKRKRQLAYYYLKKYGQPRPKMMPKPDDSNSFFCGCGHREDKLSELGRHKDRSGHWAYKGVGFDSLRYLIDFEDLRINPPNN